MRTRCAEGLFSLAAVLVVLAVCAPAAPAAEEKAGGVDPRADKVIRQLADYCAALKSFTVEMNLQVKITMGAEKHESSLDMTMAVRKPDRLFLTAKGGTLDMAVFFDGKTLTTHLPGEQAYGVREGLPALDAVLAEGQIAVLRIEEGSSAGPTPGALMMSKPYEAIMSGVTEGSYVGEEEVDGAKCQHVHFVRKDYDWDMWVEVGDKPLVRKVVPDLSKIIGREAGDADGEVKLDIFWVFRNWATDPDLPDEKFVFVPPAGARKVEPRGPGPDGEPAELLGKAAPAFKLPLLDGTELDLAAHKDKNIVVLDFWATWCGPCRKAMPIVVEVARAHKDKGVVLYAVNEGEGAKDIRAFLEDSGLEVQVALDSDGRVGDLYKVTGIPQTVIVGKDGTVQAVHVGVGDDLKERLTKELETLVAGQSLVKPPAAEGQKNE